MFHCSRPTTYQLGFAHDIIRIVTDFLAGVLEVAEKNAGREFLVSPERGLTLTFGEFSARACGLARHLEGLGIARQDRVLALLPNSAEYALLYFACLYLGATVVPVNPALHARDIRFILRGARAKLIIHSDSTGRFLEEADQPRWGMAHLDDPLFELPWRPGAGVWDSDIWTMVFTSGTTAFPKAVAHKIGSLLGNARAFNEAMGIVSGHRFLHLFPMANSGGFFNLLIAPYLAGASVVLTEGYGPRTALDFWRQPMAYGVNMLWLTPSIASALLIADRDETGRAWCRENIQLALIGMAPLPRKVKRDFEASYGIPLYESYGLSETLLVCAQGPKTGAAEGSVGAPLAGMGLSVRDGEIFIKTPHLMAGYLDLEKDTVNPASPEEWFASGDLGSVSADGRLSVTGRKKDIIIRAGLNVSPAAIEEVLLEHPAVELAAVVGIPSEPAGEEIAAVVKLKPGLDAASAKASIESFCKTGFAAASRPAWVLLRPEFPFGVTGKVLKRELRDWAVSELRCAA